MTVRAARNVAADTDHPSPRLFVSVAVEVSGTDDRAARYRQHLDLAKILGAMPHGAIASKHCYGTKCAQCIGQLQARLHRVCDVAPRQTLGRAQTYT